MSSDKGLFDLRSETERVWGVWERDKTAKRPLKKGASGFSRGTCFLYDQLVSAISLRGLAAPHLAKSTLFKANLAVFDHGREKRLFTEFPTACFLISSSHLS